jgi:hypothetical protein
VRFLVLMADADHADTWDALDDAGQEQVFERFRAFTAAVRERGELLTVAALERPSDARTVRAGDGPDRPVTQGPFAETVEHLGGLWIVELPDLDTAVSVAKLLPSTYSIEVRPLMDID